jgi:hypothetical protein
MLIPPALAEELKNPLHRTPFCSLLSLLLHKSLQVKNFPPSRNINVLYLLETRFVPKLVNKEEYRDDDHREVRLEECSHTHSRAHFGVANRIEADPELCSEDL